ncbi:MAG: AIR synthase family protein [Lachnospiraceae bacterium]|nr:AIR synthase family protein [Lachnospiraceae bacterium]
MEDSKILEIGKVPETVLKRSVLKNISVIRPEVLVGSGIGEDCAALRLSDDEDIVMSCDPITATSEDIGNLCVLVTVNDLASAGASAIGLMITALLPPGSTESQLADIMKDINEACKDTNVCILGGHTEITEAVNKPLLSVTGIGKVKRGRLITTSGAKPGMDLIVTKWIGLEGSSIIAKEKEEELLSVFPKTLVDSAKKMDSMISVQKDGLIAAEHGAAAMHDVTEGGIYGALWELCEASSVGLDADLSLIPIKQETVEICEHYAIDPYKLISSGSMLIATENGEGLIQKLNESGIHASIIGKTTDSKAKIVHYDGQDKYLGAPETDELYKVL